MMSLPIVGIGAGLASALLFAVVITGSPLAILLSYVAPLPVLIAALGWRHQAGLLATAAGALAIALALRPAAGVVFALGVGLPAWLIAYLALLGRPVTGADGADTIEWYPLGRLLLWIAAISAIVTVAGAMAISTDHDAYQTAMRETLAMVLRGPPGGMGAGRGSAAAEDLARALAPLVPLLAGASFVPMIAANLWLGAKATQVSGRLPRPWPDLAATRVPREGGMILALSGIGHVALAGFPALAAGALFGAICGALCLSGLAFLHAATRGRSWRGLVLGVVYVALLLLPAAAIVLPLLVLLGLADSFLTLRARNPAASQPPL